MLKKNYLTRDLSMSNFFKISILIILFFLNFASFASEIKVTAKAKVNYNNEFSEDIKDEALILAKKAALKKATKKFKKDKLTLIKRLKELPQHSSPDVFNRIESSKDFWLASSNTCIDWLYENVLHLLIKLNSFLFSC